MLRSFLVPVTIVINTNNSEDNKHHNVKKHDDSQYRHYLKKTSIHMIQILLSDVPTPNNEFNNNNSCHFHWRMILPLLFFVLKLLNY